jgi:hypothetical protein
MAELTTFLVAKASRISRMVSALRPFDLPIFEVHRSLATEDRHGDTELSALRIDLFNNTILVLKGAVSDFHFVTNLKTNLGLDGVFALPHLGEQTLDLLLPHWNRPILGSSKSDDSVGVFDKVPRLLDELIVLIKKVHVHNQITRKELPRRLCLFAALDFLDALSGDQHFIDVVRHLLELDAPEEILLHLLLQSRKDVDDVPLISRGYGHRLGFCQEADDIDEDEVEESDVATQDQHRNQHDHRRIHEFFVSLETLLVWVPRPLSLAQLGTSFPDKLPDLSNHRRALLTKTGQEGLEPPTGGFGDRCSTN